MHVVEHPVLEVHHRGVVSQNGIIDDGQEPAVVVWKVRAAVFGGNLTENTAKGLAVAALKRTVLKHPIKVISKELSKLIPGLGQIFAPAVSVALMEATGWALVKELKQMEVASSRYQECP